ncbi:MAG: CRISPR-associated endonuclease Cas1, partial [Huintestinicola sp.]
MDGENIVIKMSDEQVFRMPFANLESVFCFSYLGCSPALMGKMCECGISLNFISPHGRFLGRLQGTTRGNVL